MNYIAHAGAAAVDWPESHYTDTLSTMEYNYSKGFRLFEIDLMFSLDGQELVCTHGWHDHENTPDMRRFPEKDFSAWYDPEHFPTLEEITDSR